jgi:hypothetical protein
MFGGQWQFTTYHMGPSGRSLFYMWIFQTSQAKLHILGSLLVSICSRFPGLTVSSST